MSDFHAIGGVSATIKALLEDRMQLPEGVTRDGLTITIGTPRSEQNDQMHAEGPRINLFLYRVEENGHLKNQDIPGQGHLSNYGHPPLSLDLHYIVTAYGSTMEGDDFVDETQAQFLLGSAMRVLHEYPIVDEKLKAENKPLKPTILHLSLRGQFERVKIYLESLGLEDLSKIWTALTLPYRLSAAYKVRVVQIERLQPKHIALPVLDISREDSPLIHIVPFRQPKISSIEPMMAKAGEVLTIKGLNLESAAEVKIDRLSLPAIKPAGGIIQVTLATETYPDGSIIREEDMLRAGPQSLQVISEVATMPGKHLSSNVAVFMLTPEIISVTPTSGRAGSSISVSFTPAFRQGDRAYLFIGDVGLEAEPPSSRISNELVFLLPSITEEMIDEGTYPLRLRINGAESRYEYSLVDGKPVPTWRFQVLP